MKKMATDKSKLNSKNMRVSKKAILYAIGKTDLFDDLFAMASGNEDANDGVNSAKEKEFDITYKNVRVQCRIDSDDEYRILITDMNFIPHRQYDFCDSTYQRVLLKALDHAGKLILEMDSLISEARHAKKGYKTMVDRLAEAMLEDAVPKGGDKA